MKKKHLNLLLCSCVILFITSCQKNIDKPFNGTDERSSAANANAENSRRVYVSTLDELYAAVNNPDNAGVNVILSPGVYVLNAAYPNGGRLELQPDMSLSGQPGNINAVLIDQSSLPFASFRLSPTITIAPIRMGRGTNSLEWLSVKGGSVTVNPLSAIESDLVGDETNVIISHVYVDCNGSRTGILFRNRTEHVNRIINATLEHTEIANAISNPNPPGAGLALQNRTSGSQIKLSMKGNYIHACRIGILNFNSGLGISVENCLLDITSHNDRIEGNGCGLDLSGGSTGVGVLYANNNTTTLKMYTASIQGNGLSQFPTNNGAFPAGISATGGWNTASHNVLSVSLWGSHIADNNGTDIHAYGYLSTNGIVTGTHNLFVLSLFGTSANAIVVGANSTPVEPGGTNVLNVVRN